MLKAAVIGLGSMGRNHARVYREIENVHLCGVVDSNKTTVANVSRLQFTPGFESVDELLKADRPDLVSLAVPTSMHFEFAMQLVEQGIHVLVEKPITQTVEQAERLVAAAQSHGVTLAVGHIERFNPVIVELRRRLGEGMLGRLYQLHAHRLSPYPSRISDTGVVMDLASHDIDLMLHLVNEPVVRLFGETLGSINDDREDLFNGMMKFRSGAVGILDVNWMTPRKVRTLTLTGSRGMFTCDLLRQELFFYENNSAPSQWDQLSILHGVSEGNVLGIRIERKEPLRAEIEDFIRAVSDGVRPRVDGQDARETLRTALAFIGSGRESVVQDMQTSVIA